jgi:hypothetical protein
MKKVLIVIIVTALATAVGLYFRPSYTLIGQLDWWNVLTKGYFVGSFSKFFSQGLLDESFYYVMRYTGGGFVGGILVSLMMGKSKGSSKGSAKKKK